MKMDTNRIARMPPMMIVISPFCPLEAFSSRQIFFRRNSSCVMLPVAGSSVTSIVIVTSTSADSRPLQRSPIANVSTCSGISPCQEMFIDGLGNAIGSEETMLICTFTSCGAQQTNMRQLSPKSYEALLCVAALMRQIACWRQCCPVRILVPRYEPESNGSSKGRMERLAERRAEENLAPVYVGSLRSTEGTLTVGPLQGQ
uniref:Uncharacterized protein n=1 Tax=Anopheles farauti TaxID=69004 RepID=A0A182QMM6_9DIPT